MGYELMDLKSAAAHLHMKETELKHFAQRGEVESRRRGDDFFFEHRTLDEWAQRRVMSISAKVLTDEHRLAMTERKRSDGQDFHIADLLRSETIQPRLTAKTRAGVLRDMTDFADSTGLLYDSETLFAELSAREEVASTAAGNGVACYLAALRGGADGIDLSMAPMSGGTCQPDIITMWHCLDGDPDFGFDCTFSRVSACWRMARTSSRISAKRKTPTACMRR